MMVKLCDNYKLICSAADAANATDNEDRPEEEKGGSSRWTNYQWFNATPLTTSRRIRNRTEGFFQKYLGGCLKAKEEGCNCDHGMGPQFNNNHIQNSSRWLSSQVPRRTKGRSLSTRESEIESENLKSGNGNH